jgi:uncharacterized protein YecA (UPF0149 family)
MDIRDGKILTAKEVATLSEFDKQFVKPMKIFPTKNQLSSNRIGRNEPCPCGSGKKFKNCCLLPSTTLPQRIIR